MDTEIPKICHFYWDGSPFSYFNYLTAKSFRYLNHDWKMIVYMPIKRQTIKSWLSFEQKVEYTGPDYFYMLNSLSNIEFNLVDYDKIGFDNDKSEVIKSDYLRYYLLSTIGGLWSDFDIFYIKPIPKVTQKVVLVKDPEYYPVGFLMASANNQFFKYLLDQVPNFLDTNRYQSIGCQMLNVLLKDYVFDDSFLILDVKSYLPFQWYDQQSIWIDNKEVPEETFGIHWFNGGQLSRDIINRIDPYNIPNYKGTLFQFINKPRLVVFGANGMLGNCIAKYFKYNVIAFNRSHIDASTATEQDVVDLFDLYGIDKECVVFNGIGLIPSACNNQEKMMKVNGIWPFMLANICQQREIKMIHPTTDCVFSGRKGKAYIETDIHDDDTPYGRSKSWGDLSQCTIIRASIIGHEIDNKRSLLSWVLSNKNGEVNGYMDHIWNGITTLEYAKIVEKIIKTKEFWNGVKHIKSEEISKYELIKKINEIYDLNIKIKPYVTHEYINRCLDTVFNESIVVAPLEQQIKELRSFYNQNTL